MIGCDWLDIMEEVVPPLRSLAAFSHAKVHLSRGDVVCIPKNSEIQEMKEDYEKEFKKKFDTKDKNAL